MYIDRVAEALAALHCTTWCHADHGIHAEDCPLAESTKTAAGILADNYRAARESEQSAYRRRVETFGLPALLAPYSHA